MNILDILLSWPNVLVTILFVAFIIVFRAYVIEKRFPKANCILLIGLTGSGKTTLITRLFGEILAQRLLGVQAKLLGVDTIERINKYIMKLDKREPIGLTKSDKGKPYRADMRVGSEIFGRKYRIELKDFPGERSLDLIRAENELIFTTQEFYDYARTADSFVFIVDVGDYLLSKKGNKHYASILRGQYRAAWQKLVDMHHDPDSEMKKKPLVLAFTKSDLFQYSTKQISRKILYDKVKTLGFQKLSKIEKVEEQKLLEGSNNILNDFNDLIQFFQSKNDEFEVVFTSSFWRLEEEILNLKSFLYSVLPRQNLIDTILDILKGLISPKKEEPQSKT